MPWITSSDVRLDQPQLYLPICRLLMTAVVQQWLPVSFMILFLSPSPVIYPPLHG